MRISLILLSAGKGRRLENSIPKAVIKLKNKPLFYYSLLALQNTEIFDYISVVIPRGYKSVFEKYIKKYNLKVDALIIGGKERVDSVRRGFSSLPECDYVFIHDSARPFVSKKLVLKLYRAVLRYKAVIPVRKITFTVKKCQHGFVKQTIDRTDLYEVQTPQAFSYQVLKTGIENYPSKKVKLAIPDDSFLIELINKKVKTIPGEVRNFKITFPEELKLAERLI
jgi:2-C-methyl-D-erythritol 4-phosphate cytidylyltransferase